MARLLLGFLISLITLFHLCFGETISIKAEKISGDNRVVHYVGNVRAITDSNKKLYCNLLTIFLTKDGKIQKILAKGHVIFQSGNYTAISDKLTYLPLQHLIIAEGNAMVKNSKSIIKGRKIFYNLLTKKFYVQGPVNSIFVIKNSN